MIVGIWVVYPHDCRADWELWVPVAAQHHERGWYCIWLAWEKIKIQITVSTECIYMLSHQHKVKE